MKILRLPSPGKLFERGAAIVLGCLMVLSLSATEPAVKSELKSAAIEARGDADEAHFAIQAEFKGMSEGRDKSVYGATIQQVIQPGSEGVKHRVTVKFDAIQGGLGELIVVMAGEGEVKRVTGTELADWSVRQGSNGIRGLVLRTRKSEPPVKTLTVDITAETARRDATGIIPGLTFTLESPLLANGYVVLESDASLELQLRLPTGLVPIETQYLPENLRSSSGEVAGAVPNRVAYRFLGTVYSLPLELTNPDPEARRVGLRDFGLTGQLSDETASFTLTAIARVKHPSGGSVELLSGRVALTASSPGAEWRLRYDQGRYWAVFDRAGEFPLNLQFNANVQRTNGWNQIDFTVAPGTLQPVRLQRLKADTQLRMMGAARPERVGEEFTSFLPADGRMNLNWQESRPAAEGALFFAAEALSQITISPGVMRQTAWFDFKVMQGELSQVTLRLRGEGEVVRVQGPQVLSWIVEPVADSPERRLTVRLNQGQKDQFPVQIQTQTPLGVFPLATNAVQIRPEGATRFGGYYRIVNEGAVRLEVIEASGLSQISPEQFPRTEATKALPAYVATQEFAYRFSGESFGLRIQADNILPELSVSEVLTYHLGETELAIDAELELDVREAPLRELLLRVPKGYTVARLNASGLSDYFLTEPAGETEAQLRLVYGAPLAGRQLVQLRLERNGGLGADNWALPRIDIVKVKSLRGHVAVRADAGFRLTPTLTQGLTDIGIAYFPKKIPGLQAAFRLSEPGWQATLQVERMPQSVQADSFHLFSVGEGIAYGSTLVNYLISGAPVARFRVALTNEYFNVEFTGKDVRNWQKVEGGYVVQLHTPVSGTYTLLATYERPFKAQGETLRFSGAQPLDAQAEQGHSIVVSTHQFEVSPVNVSPGLVRLEPGEVPAEYRLFFDAPILAAYRFTARPYNLQLELKPLMQHETVNQVVDRAAMVSRISKEGQVVTEARYFVKNKGLPNFRLTLPDGSQLWSVTVNGNSVVPVTAGGAQLIPLPAQADPNAVMDLQVKLASRAVDARRLTVALPRIAGPVLLSEWKIEPESGQRLVYRSGTITPERSQGDSSGFGGLLRLLRGSWSGAAGSAWIGAVGLLLLTTWVLRIATGRGANKFGVRHLLGGVIGLLGTAGMVLLLGQLVELARGVAVSPVADLRFVAAIQQPETPWSAEINNLPMAPSAWMHLWAAWPAVVGIGLWLYGWVVGSGGRQRLAVIGGWTLVLWAALRMTNGAPVFIVTGAVFILWTVMLPAVQRWWMVSSNTKNGEPPAGGATPASVPATMIALLTFVWMAAVNPPSALAQAPVGRTQRVVNPPAIPESVRQQIRVQDDFVMGVATFHWQATAGQVLPLLHGSGVLTKATFPPEAGHLVRLSGADGQAFVVEKTGALEGVVEYQLPVSGRAGGRGFVLPTQPGLVNQLTLLLLGLEADLDVPQAVSLRSLTNGTNRDTSFEVILTPAKDSWIGWLPRRRDTRREKVVFFAEMTQLLVPGAGIVEGWHEAQIRPAQGELNELVVAVPPGWTITDVLSPLISQWRFDPTLRKLRVGLNSCQAKPFSVLIKSQLSTGPLPAEANVGGLSLDNAAAEVGLFGLATGAEVQLDDVTSDALSPINLEDFPTAMLEAPRAQVAGLTLRRAFRYASPGTVAKVKVSAVEPDVRVESQQTISLGEDRTVLAANLNVAITRAGIFRLSFALPPNFDVESISGAALSHWTELKQGTNRWITLHLKSRTDGNQSFAISLTAPGVRATPAWTVPRLGLREAGKQRGQLLVVPEQGLRLQVGAREAVTQLDPLQSGVRQKGVLAFRLLQSDWSLTLDLERVDAWTQVTSLQHILLNEAQIRVTGNLQYEIENAGLKSLYVRLPGNAENLRFRGDQVADFVPRSVQTNAVMKDWEIKLNRRVSGKFLLQVNYLQPLTATATNVVVGGIEAQEVNLQRGFVTVQSASRLQVRIEPIPAALQATEWTGIPHSLQTDLAGLTPSHAFRLVEPAFQLPLKLDRHGVAKLLPARVNRADLTSVVADDGTSLTHVQLSLVPGDQRLLRFSLPDAARFWFALVGQNSVNPWREGDQILLPLEQHAKTREPVTVEIFYTRQAGKAQSRTLDFNLAGPRFELPLENIQWRVFLNNKWQLRRWGGTLELQPSTPVTPVAGLDLASYVRREAGALQEKTKEAEQFLTAANSWLEKGDPEQARWAFKNAFGLSQHDNAFNEDARVQLHNLKTQQAIVGLNVRQAKVAGESAGLAATPRNLREGQEAAYTQQEAKQLLARNSAEDNAGQMRLVERLIQQQEATTAVPTAIRATVPEQGRQWVFARSLDVETNSELRITMRVRADGDVGWNLRLLVLTLVFLGLGAFSWMGKWARD